MALYITEDVDVFEGHAARDMLEEKSDLRWLDPELGIVRVPAWRWEEAQRYERTQWMERGLARENDRNDVHFENFDHYRMLRERKFKRAIEIGCGPFTNLRYIVGATEIEKCDLLDPLIEEYVEHPGCVYRDGEIEGVEVGSRIAEPIEDADLEGYDLVVAINVLEHCRNAMDALASIYNAAEPGGVIVFHDRCYRVEDLEQMLAERYDAGHPLRPDQRLLFAFCNLFRVSLFRMVDPHLTWDHGPRDALYFIGVKP